MINKFKKHILLACAVLSISASGQATTVYLRDTPTSGHFVPGLSQNNVGSINNSWNGTAGTLDLELSLTSSTSGFFSLLTYCIDPVRSLAVGPANGTGSAFSLISMLSYFTNYTPAVANAGTTTDSIQKLWANAFTDSKTTDTKAAAFQFLLWEYIADSASFDLDSGVIKVTSSSVKAQANAWNSAMANWTSVADLSVVSGFNTKQSFIYEPGGTGTNENVPEPGTYALIGAGLFTLGYFRRK